jgi:hypothetical protein
MASVTSGERVGERESDFFLGNRSEVSPEQERCGIRGRLTIDFVSRRLPHVEPCP